MKLLGAVFVASLAGPLCAQFWSVGVVTPARPHGPNAASQPAARRYGSSYGVGRGYRRVRSSYVYAFPVFIGSYGYGYAPDQPAPPTDDSAAAAPAETTGPAPNDQSRGDTASSENFRFYQTPANTNAAESEPSSYLIAFKDHTIYSAVAYYVDGDTLHYFTTGNVHNQVSLSLVDRQLTEQLNHQHNADVLLP